ncbi:hypothetical protein BaRGS_00036676 [Batillaria attramentaria]|uniref:Uncharacterized protein n=1 Tax=Batillaria attramentaria TaxID=370345 RepID=A0ABD0JCG9_9CAEN
MNELLSGQRCILRGKENLRIKLNDECLSNAYCGRRWGCSVAIRGICTDLKRLSAPVLGCADARTETGQIIVLSTGSSIEAFQRDQHD